MCLEKHNQICNDIIWILRKRRRMLPGRIYTYIAQRWGIRTWQVEGYLHELSARGIVDTDPPYFILGERCPREGAEQMDLLGLLIASAGGTV